MHEHGYFFFSRSANFLRIFLTFQNISAQCMWPINCACIRLSWQSHQGHTGAHTGRKTQHFLKNYVKIAGLCAEMKTLFSREESSISSRENHIFLAGNHRSSKTTKSLEVQVGCHRQDITFSINTIKDHSSVIIHCVPLAKQGDNALGSVHPSVCLWMCVCLSELSCLNRLT